MNIANMIKFQLKQMSKTNVMFMTFFIYPVILTAIIGYLTQENFSGGVTSYQYYSIGMMIFIFAGAGLSSAYNFLDEGVKAGNSRAIFAPVKTGTIYLSQILSGTIYSSIGALSSLVIFKLLFGVDYNGNGILIFLSFLVLCFMSNALGMFLCTAINNIGIVNMVFNIVQAVLCVLGGAFFSLEALGGIPAMVSKISPVKWLMDGLLNSIYDSNNSILIVIIGVNIILGIILILLTSRTFKSEKYL
ncbi:MAG: ABC transporter permease [Clostridium sp.]